MFHIFEEGKYSVGFAGGKISAFRHGLFWQDLTGDKLIYSMLSEIDSLKNKLTDSQAALAHRDEQVKGLVEALKNINQLANKYAGDYPTQIGTISQAALAAYKEQTK